MTKELLKQALEYLQDNQHWVADGERHAYVMEYNAFIDKLKQALAQPEQEPVAFAGVKAWVGNQQVVRYLTQTEIHYANQPWLHMLMNAEMCIAQLKEKNT